ncbi:MAG: hypothetical protein IKI45_08880 [Oscillospiraceae bacterium]|nr:hypothetical protein [Oscillospiraceae bacterium]
MKMQWIMPVLLGTAFCLTGCGKGNEITIQRDTAPVVPIETAVSGTSGSSTETNTGSKKETITTVRQTTISKTETAVLGTTQHTADAAENTAPQNNGSSSGKAAAANMLYGKWETVSFSKDSGGRVSYDLADPAHRSYYVGLELNEGGQSTLTVGTEDHSASTSMQGNLLTVCTVDPNDPVDMVFSVSEDRTQMTAELMNGRIIATLKRISHDFSIKDFLNAKPVQDASVLIGEWVYVNPDSTPGSVIEVQADGSFFETLVENNLITAGTVKAENGGYAFYDSENHLYLRFTPDPLTPNTYLDDKSQGGRLVSIAEYEQPNDWGYYDPVIYPATSISVAGLNGIWKNADGSGESFEIYDGRSIYHGRFALTDADGKEERGDVRLQYRYNQDGKKEFCFTFYGDNGTIYYTLDASGSIPMNDLFGDQSGELHFIRQE